MTELATANKQIPELPHSIEAEQAVLGALMLANDAFDSVASLITEEDFYGQDHRLIFETMKELADKDQPLDPITLSEALKSLHLLEEAGGDSYLVNIARNTPSSENIRAYAQIILERSIVRKLILAASEIAQKGYNPLGWDSSKLLAEAERRLLEV
ncbi:MAG: replicative DNA helicase, partial [Gammaproteobacteria bacterium]